MMLIDHLNFGGGSVPGFGGPSGGSGNFADFVRISFFCFISKKFKVNKNYIISYICHQQNNMNILRKILLLFFLHFVLGITLYSKSHQNVNCIKYTKNIETNYNRGNFSLSLFNLFQTVKSYRLEGDSNSLYKTWSRISLLYYQMQKSYHGDAAFTVSQKYKPKDSEYYSCLCLAYKEVVCNRQSIKVFSRLIPDSTDWFIVKSKIYLDFLGLLNQQKEKQLNDQTYSDCLKLLHVLRSKSDTSWFGFADINFQIGTFYLNKREFLLSIPYFLRVKEILKNNLQFNEALINTYYDLIFIDYNLNEDTKQRYYNELTNIFNKGEIQKQYLYFYYVCKGQYFYYCKNYNDAINSFLEALHHSNGINYRKEYLINRIIDLYYSLDKFGKIIEIHNQNKNVLLNAQNLASIALSYYKVGKGDLAKQYLDKVLEQLLFKSPLNKNVIYGILANAYFEIKDFANAGKYFTYQLKSNIDLFGYYHLNTAISYSSLAYFQWIGKGNIALALQYYHKEICVLTKTDFNSDIFQLPDISISINKETLARALRNKAEAFYELSKVQKTKAEEVKYLKTCIRWFELAIDVVSKYKFSLLKEEQKLIYSDVTKHYYPYIFQAAIELYQKTGDRQYVRKIFEYIEKSKASTLLSMVRGADARRMNLIPGQFIHKETEIQKETQNFLQLLNLENNKANPDNACIDKYNSELEHLKQQQDSLLGIYKNEYSEYYNICFKNDVVGADSLQKLIKSNQVVLQYSVSAKMLLVFLITKDTIMFYKENIDERFFSEVEHYRKGVSCCQFSDIQTGSVRTFENVANGLYNKLLKHFEKFLIKKELIIFPDDVLNTIPFESLVTSKLTNPHTINYRTLNYVIKKNPVGYNYSASLYAYTNMSRTNSIYPSRLLAVAPMGFSYNESSLSKSNFYNERNEGDPILPIPGSVEEAKAASRIFGGKLLIRKHATESEFKRIAGDYTILHLASHGIMDNKNPLLSKILFAPEKDLLNDGFLNTWEVYSMQLNAPLVVLSACNTGYGKLFKGEGIISLARGFFLTGTQNVVMTLWSVADKTSGRLMQNFYKHLSCGSPVNIALQQAKTDYLKNADGINSHPYFWAGYVTIGNSDLQFEKPIRRSVFYWIGGLFLGIVLIFTLFYLRKKHH